MPTMPCRITDGPSDPEDAIWPEVKDEDAAYERTRQREIDDGSADIARSLSLKLLWDAERGQA